MGVTWTNAALLVYLVGMIAFVVHAAEAARENKDNNPTVDAVTRNPQSRAMMAMIVIFMSPLWPWFAVKAVLGWVGRWAGRAAVRLEAVADRIEAERKP